MFFSFLGLLVVIAIVILSLIKPRNLFGDGGGKNTLIGLLAAKELADIAFRNNKENLPDFARTIYERVRGRSSDGPAE